MKKLLTLSLFIFTINSIAQTAISDVTGYTPNPKAVLDVNSTTKGLLLPRLTSAQRIAIAPTASQAGLTVFDTNTKSQWFFDGIVWKEMAGDFSLPYSGTNNDGNNALDINNTVGRAAYFQSPNSSETMRVYNSGTGNAITVDGHLNVTGTIKANGVDGMAGQILTNNGDGTISWANTCNFRYFKDFFNPMVPFNPSTWTVPMGVTLIMVEILGAGGGGSSAFGGGGGGYIKTLIDVVPGEVLTIELGTGGLGIDGGGTQATKGESTILTAGSLGFTAHGGSAGTTGLGGSVSIPTATKSSFRQNGNNGKPQDISYFQISATEFVQKTVFGDGGSPGNEIGNFSGHGGIYIANVLSINGSPGKRFGSGGGGGAGSGFNFGGNGGGGYVIIHW